VQSDIIPASEFPGIYMFALTSEVLW